MKRCLQAALLVFALSPLAAHAGKEERDFVSATVEPAVKQAAATYKKSCGCDVKFDIKYDTFKSMDELRQIRNFSNTIHEKAAGYCTDAATKTAMCKLKTLEFSKTNQTTLQFSGSKATATSDGSSFPSWDMLAREVDK